METKIRKLLKDMGADIVRHCSDDSWHALWYQHPRNIGSNGHYVLIGLTTHDAVNGLRGLHCNPDIL